MHFQLLSLLSLGSLALAANDASCGTKGPLPPHLAGHPRIIDGTDARPHEFPWQCSLQKGNPLEHSCGASILNDRWLLTAGHCTAKNDNETHPADHYRVICGAHDLAKPSGTEVNASIARLFLHPKFHVNMSVDYDFSLIKLSEALPLNNVTKHLATICLPDASEPLDQIAGKSCISAGWGISSRGDKASKTILQKATFTVMKQAACNEKWTHKEVSIAPAQPIYDWDICVEGGNRSICNGDSGGPLNCWINGRWYNYGVVSFGDLDPKTFDCVASGKMPDVFGRATAAVNWVWETVASH